MFKAMMCQNPRTVVCAHTDCTEDNIFALLIQFANALSQNRHWNVLCIRNRISHHFRLFSHIEKDCVIVRIRLIPLCKGHISVQYILCHITCHIYRILRRRIWWRIGQLQFCQIMHTCTHADCHTKGINPFVDSVAADNLCTVNATSIHRENQFQDKWKRSRIIARMGILCQNHSAIITVTLQAFAIQALFICTCCGCCQIKHFRH